MNITVYDIDNKTAEEAVDKVFEYITNLEKITSAKFMESEIGFINSNHMKESIQMSPELTDIMKIAVEWSAITNGAFDVTLGNLSSLWQVDSDAPHLPEKEEIDLALSSVGFKNIDITGNFLTLKKDVSLDLGAIVKGYATDKVVSILKSYGIKSAIINLGGNIYALGKKKDGDWKIYLTDPIEPSEYTAILYLSDKTVVTSGNYQRYFEKNGKRFHHIFDSTTGYPAESGIISATVITDNSTLGDILSTAFFVLGAEKSAKLKEKLDFPLEYILINEKGEHILSEGFNSNYELLEKE